MKVALLCLGCKVNQSEISDLESSLTGDGHDIVGLRDKPDVCVVNTCTVTARSDYQSRQLIRRAERSGARVVVTGCYSELNREETFGLGEIETVVPNKNKDALFNVVTGGKQANPANGRGSRARKVIKVQDGCDNSCSYCIVPRARGKSKSVEPDNVVDRILQAERAGHGEVVLSGIHLGQYGTDLDGSQSLSRLLRDALKSTSTCRIRLSSLEVTELDDELLDVFSDERICNHVHIPLQSGDDSVLRAMNRNYSSAQYRETVSKIASRFSNIGIGTDVIAGFPAETEEAHVNTKRMVEEMPFSYVHVFPFSSRPNTPAARMQDIAGDKVRTVRAAELRAIAEIKMKAFKESQIGNVLELLVEDEISRGIYRGTTGNYLKVNSNLSGVQKGSVVPVRIEECRDNELLGNYVKVA